MNCSEGRNIASRSSIGSSARSPGSPRSWPASACRWPVRRERAGAADARRCPQDGADVHRGRGETLVYRGARAAQPRRADAGVVPGRVAARSRPAERGQPSARPVLHAGRALPGVFPDGDQPAERAGDPGPSRAARGDLPARATRGRRSGIPASRPTARGWSSASPTSAASGSPSVDRTGQGFTILAASAGINGWPSYSPDGQRIAFASSRDGDLEIYAMDADGSQVARLTRSPGRDLRPAWSPDGKRIAFTSAATATRRSTSSTPTARTRGISPGTPAAIPTRPGTPTAVGSPSSPIATASPRSTYWM